MRNGIRVAFVILIVAGALHAQGGQGRSQVPTAFEVISIRPGNPDRTASLGARGGGSGNGGLCAGSLPRVDPSRIVFNNNSLYGLIALAYGLNCVDARAASLVSGGPDWAKSSQWVIQALIPEATGELVTPSAEIYGGPHIDPKLQKMLQNLLAVRFKLALHRETRQIQVYKMMVAEGGSKLQRPDSVPCDSNVFPQNSGPLPMPGSKPHCTFVMRGS